MWVNSRDVPKQTISLFAPAVLALAQIEDGLREQALDVEIADPCGGCASGI